MAFQQPIQRPTRRAATPPPIATTASQPKKAQQVEESQEWVLFSPAAPSEQATRDEADVAVRTATPVTPKTFNKSRLSDFGSLDTAAVSERHRLHKEENEDEEQLDEDDSEADSLDEGLHAFNEPASVSIPSAHHCLDSSIAEPVLPAHDGLGGFTGSSAPVQQQLWQHERYNPQRANHGSSSLRRSEVQRRLDALNEEEKTTAPKDPTEERNRRIEKWRLDQSKAIVEEIERETRRRRRRSKLSQSSIAKPDVSDQEASKESAIPSEQSLAHTETAPSVDSPSLWSRTRRMIRDLIGIDDATLTYIFGETLSNADQLSRVAAPEQTNTARDMIAHAERTVPNSIDVTKQNSSWEDNLIARLARELGSIVNSLSDHPPGAFSTYMKVQEAVPYAGLPTPPELSTPAGFLQFNGPSTPSRPTQHFRHRRRTSMARTDPSLFGIEEEPATGEDIEEDNDLTPQQSRRPAPEEEQRLKQEKNYWEQDLDINMVFSYIKSRLQRRSSQNAVRAGSSAAQPNAPTFSSASASGPDALRRAALIRHHHPLVSRNINALRAASQSTLNSQASQLPPTPLSPILGRRNSSVIDDAASSCASQSTKRSKTHHSGSLSINSSRNYWDIGGPSWGQV